jgi:hypothetical protein
MPHENENNRSTAMTPEMVALVTAATASAVKEAIAGMAGMMEHTVRELALTPEKIREANKPYKDPAVELREIREKIKFKKEEIQNEKNKRIMREKCTHKYKNGIAAVAVVRNFPDRQPRGICMLCHDWFFPREWRIGMPTEAEPDGTALVVDAHPKYQLVWDAINQQEG